MTARPLRLIAPQYTRDKNLSLFHSHYQRFLEWWKDSETLTLDRLREHYLAIALIDNSLNPTMSILETLYLSLLSSCTISSFSDLAPLLKDPFLDFPEVQKKVFHLTENYLPTASLISMLAFCLRLKGNGLTLLRPILTSSFKKKLASVDSVAAFTKVCWYFCSNERCSLFKDWLPLLTSGLCDFFFADPENTDPLGLVVEFLLTAKTSISMNVEEALIPELKTRSLEYLRAHCATLSHFEEHCPRSLVISNLCITTPFFSTYYLELLEQEFPANTTEESVKQFIDDRPEDMCSLVQYFLASRAFPAFFA